MVPSEQRRDYQVTAKLRFLLFGFLLLPCLAYVDKILLFHLQVPSPCASMDGGIGTLLTSSMPSAGRIHLTRLLLTFTAAKEKLQSFWLEIMGPCALLHATTPTELGCRIPTSGGMCAYIATKS